MSEEYKPIKDDYAFALKAMISMFVIIGIVIFIVDMANTAFFGCGNDQP